MVQSIQVNKLIKTKIRWETNKIKNEANKLSSKTVLIKKVKKSYKNKNSINIFVFSFDSESVISSQM